MAAALMGPGPSRAAMFGAVLLVVSACRPLPPSRAPVALITDAAAQPVARTSEEALKQAEADFVAGHYEAAEKGFGQAVQARSPKLKAQAFVGLSRLCLLRAAALAEPQALKRARVYLARALVFDRDNAMAKRLWPLAQTSDAAL